MQLGSRDYIYVIIQLLLFVAYSFNADLIRINDFETFKIIGISITLIGALIALIALLQLNTKLSPFPSPKSNATLITNGIYKFIRHPIYAGIIFITFGYGLYIVSLYKIIISMLLYILFHFKSSYEERRLKITFITYETYKKSSGRFFPNFFKSN